MKFKATLSAAALLLCGTAQAGPYTDQLSACLVGQSTMDDHVVIVQWMFAAMSKHPSVAAMGSVSEAQVDKANQRMAQLFSRLLTVTCRDQTRLALKNEGEPALQQGFQALGEVAGRDLFMDPNVAKGLSGMTKYIDTKKLAELRSP